MLRLTQAILSEKNENRAIIKKKNLISTEEIYQQIMEIEKVIEARKTKSKRKHSINQCNFLELIQKM